MSWKVCFPALIWRFWSWSDCVVSLKKRLPNKSPTPQHDNQTLDIISHAMFFSLFILVPNEHQIGTCIARVFRLPYSLSLFKFQIKHNFLKILSHKHVWLCSLSVVSAVSVSICLISISNLKTRTGFLTPSSPLWISVFKNIITA